MDEEDIYYDQVHTDADEDEIYEDLMSVRNRRQPVGGGRRPLVGSWGDSRAQLFNGSLQFEYIKLKRQ